MRHLAPAEIADRLGIHVASVRLMLQRGELGRPIKLGRCWRLAEDELAAALEKLRVEPLPERAARCNALIPQEKTLDLLRSRRTAP